MDPLAGQVKPSSNSEEYCHFGGGFDLDEDEGDEIDGAIAKKEGVGDSGVVVCPQVVGMLDDSRRRFFESKKPYNTSSQYEKVPIDVGLLSEYCALSDGYTIHSPSVGDRMWDVPLPGWLAIPDMWFVYGFWFPMHPFFEEILEPLDCSIGRLSPNLVL